MMRSLVICTECGQPLADELHLNAILPSPYQVLLNSDSPPSGSEALGLRRETDELVAHIEQLDEDIEKLGNHVRALNVSLNMLRKNRESLSAEVERRKGGLSPLRRCPPEILAHIFNLCEKPLVICHVSRLWREIALTTSSLWTNIKVQLSLTAMQSQTEAVTHRLLHSQGRLLTVALLYSDINECHPAMEILLTQSRRWESVELALGWGILPRVSVVKGHLPNLKTLIFRSLIHGMPLVDWFEDAPNLRNVDIRGNPLFEGGWRHLSLRWDLLSQLTANGPARVLFELLQECPNLTTCYLCLCDSPKPTKSFVHSRITSLTIEAQHSYDPFYEFATFPNLREFRLVTLGRPVTSWREVPCEGIAHLTWFLSRCSGTLRVLSLSNCVIPHGLAACLEAVPGVTHVRLERFVVDTMETSLVQRLTLKPSSEDVLIPNLENLELVADYRDNIVRLLKTSLMTMILSRWQYPQWDRPTNDGEPVGHSSSCARLRRVVIRIGMKRENLRRGNTLNCLDSLREAGLDLLLTSDDGKSTTISIQPHPGTEQEFGTHCTRRTDSVASQSEDVQRERSF